MNKKILAFPLVLSALALSSCGNNDVDLVKNGVMDSYSTTTVGKALDNWNNCETHSWESFETDNGTKVVQFTCKDKNVASSVDKVVKNLSDEDKLAFHKYLDLTSNSQIFQFTINTDDTFQIDNVQALYVWSDGAELETPLDMTQALDSAYNDTISWNSVDINNGNAYLVAQAFVRLKLKSTNTSIIDGILNK